MSYTSEGVKGFFQPVHSSNCQPIHSESVCGVWAGPFNYILGGLGCECACLLQRPCACLPKTPLVGKGSVNEYAVLAVVKGHRARRFLCVWQVERR